MFEQNLKEKYPFLTKYFESGISHPQKALAHSILFYGTDISAQYQLAQEIARLLNCKELKNETCRCVNCSWAKERKHPAIMTVSKLDSKPSDDDSKTVISVKQSQMIKNQLVTTSDYHRVFIFTDAQMQGETWVPMGLNENNFHQETANSLLKIIEEPPENVTFFFLTRDKNDLIQTIISRSQSFYVPSFGGEIQSYLNIREFFEDYPQIERKDSFDLAQKMLELSKEIPPAQIFDEIQNYLLEFLKMNFENKNLYFKILADMKSAKKAKKQLTTGILPLLAFENFFLDLTKN